MGMKVVEVEASERIEPIRGINGYAGVYILVRYRRHPVGWVTLKDFSGAVVDPEQLHEAITAQLGWQVSRVALGQGLNSTFCGTVLSPPISVVVCTRNRARQLSECLQALLALEYPDYEILIVDNAPCNDDTAQLAKRFGIRYIREDRPGLDWARNRGIAESRYEIISFTDDDARPDRNWLKAIAGAFAERDVMAVTGPVLPAELETNAQILFELSYRGMSHGFRRRRIRRLTIAKRDLLWSSSFGVGCNMAFQRELFKMVGFFDAALDAGTPSGGAGDIEMFHRLVARGHTLIYEPAAMVWHLHRSCLAALRRQLFNNGRSFGSYLLTCARNRSVSRHSIIGFAAREWLYGWIFRRFLRPGFFPRGLIMSEFAGMLISPIAYLTSQSHARRISARHQNF